MIFLFSRIGLNVTSYVKGKSMREVFTELFFAFKYDRDFRFLCITLVLSFFAATLAVLIFSYL